jgi:formate--tetrahydrofolate ligase
MTKIIAKNDATTDHLPPPGAPDIEIARAASMRPILDLAEEKLGIPAEALIPFGHYKAKLSHAFIASLSERPRGKLVLVTAITPTPAGEGKTTTSVGLNDGLNQLGAKSIVCLREPSLGPCFGMKGGAAGGGRAQVLPMEDINLHFNGDFHAITTAHNLLAALIDNHLHWGNELGIDPRRVLWKRVIDMNDRALRKIVAGLGGAAHGVPREEAFDITAASEIMAIMCLAEDLADLQERLARIVIALRHDKSPVTVRDLGAEGAMTVLLMDALQPNLVQSIEHSPAFVHGGPFANIAHGCSTLVATKAALALGDIVVTEAGFGSDLGAQKFLDIKCRQSGLRPDAVVLVCTIRALKMQGGVKKADLKSEDVGAVERGAANLDRHIENLRQYGLRPIVAINDFAGDTEAERAVVHATCQHHGVGAVLASHWAEGGLGATDLAQAVLDQLAEGSPEVELLYHDELSLIEKIRTVAARVYGASDIAVSDAAARQLKEFEALGYGRLPVCIAKTQYSFSADPTQIGAPDGHVLPVREVRLSAGAGFVVVVCGEIMTMPGLPRHPAALDIGLDEDGRIVGLS